MLKILKALPATAFVALIISIGVRGAHAAEPVKLVVGYQPYDTISYSAAVIRALDLWKKYLPAGSEVEFQNALQGSTAKWWRHRRAVAPIAFSVW